MRQIGAVLLLLGALAACGGDEGEARCDPACTWPGRCEDGICTTRCDGDAACGDPRLRCSSAGACVARCAGVICPTGSLCEETTGACVADPGRACTGDPDCGDGTMRCVEGVCVSRCADVVCDEEAGEICDPSTGTCVGGSSCGDTADCLAGSVCEAGRCVRARFSDCSGGASCAAGLTCVGNGQPSLCTSPCAAITDCAISERCADEGAGAFAGFCLPNLCRPGGDAFGFFQDAQWLGPCDAAGRGDGICVGPFGAGDQASGLCMGSGTAPPGASCSAEATHGEAEACAESVCIGATAEQHGTCLVLCLQAAEPGSTGACPAGACMAIPSDPHLGVCVGGAR